VKRALVVLFLATPALAGVVNRDVAREIREHGSARVIVMMRADAMPSLTGDDFTLTTRWHAITGFAGVARASAIAKFESDPNVASVELDLPGAAHLAQSVPMIGGDVVHAAGYTGKGITVAILDSGIDYTHPDLADRVIDQQCFCNTGCCPNGQSTQSGTGAALDENGHGTNVAGIVASKGTIASVGVAPGVKIVAVRVLDKDGAFSGLSQVISGFQWVYDNHPEVRVINASLGTFSLFTGYCDAQSSAAAQIINKLRARGTLVFISSGNQASTTQMGSPACVQNSMSVGAVYDGNNNSVTFPSVCTDATTTADQVTCFTNSNNTLDLLGPGGAVHRRWFRYWYVPQPGRLQHRSGDLPVEEVRPLARRVERGAPARRIELRERRARLHRIGDQAVVHELEACDVLGFFECLFDFLPAVAEPRQNVRRNLAATEDPDRRREGFEVNADRHLRLTGHDRAPRAAKRVLCRGGPV